MYVKTSFFDVEHEVKKDSFFVSAGIDIFFKNNVHNNFFRNLTSKLSRSIFSLPRQSRVKLKEINNEPYFLSFSSSEREDKRPLSSEREKNREKTSCFFKYMKSFS
jgi:hypothetical protein